MNTDKTNSFWLATNFILLAVISVITLKMNIEHFGKEQFGIWIILSSIWGFGSTLDFGFGTTIIKYVSEYKKDDIERISILLSSSIFLFVLLGVLIFALGNLLAFNVYFSNSSIILPELKKQFIQIFLILGLSFFVKYLTIFFNSFFEGLSKFDLTSKISILQSFFILLSVIIVTINNYDLFYLALSYLIIAIIVFLIFVFIFITKYKSYKLNISFFKKSELKKVLKFSVSVQLMSVFNALIDPLIKYLIGNFYNISIVPAYEIARRFATAISGLYFNTFKIILPKTSILLTYDERSNFINHKLFIYCKFGVLYSGIFYGVLLLPFILFIKHFFGIDEAILIFIILSLPESINNFGYSIYNFLLGVGKVHFLSGLQLINLLITAVTLIIGFTLFNNAVALIGYFISVLIGNILMVVMLRKKWNLNVSRFLNDVKIYKLILFIISLFTLTIFWVYGSYDYLTPVYLFSIFMLIIFINDIIEFIKKLFVEIKIKF